MSTVHNIPTDVTPSGFVQAEIYELDSKFQRACTQVVLLNNFVQELQTRYDRAVKQNLRTYRYALRLRLCTVEGLRNMFYEYASATADKIDELEQQMRDMGVEPAIIYGEAAAASASSTNSQNSQADAADDSVEED